MLILYPDYHGLNLDFGGIPILHLFLKCRSLLNRLIINLRSHYSEKPHYTFLKYDIAAPIIPALFIILAATT